MVHGKLFLFAAFLFKAEQIPFPGRIIIFDLQVHYGADTGERVGKDPQQSAKAGTKMVVTVPSSILSLGFGQT